MSERVRHLDELHRIVTDLRHKMLGLIKDCEQIQDYCYEQLLGELKIKE